MIDNKTVWKLNLHSEKTTGTFIELDQKKKKTSFLESKHCSCLGPNRQTLHVEGEGDNHDTAEPLVPVVDRVKLSGMLPMSDIYVIPKAKASSQQS